MTANRLGPFNLNGRSHLDSVLALLGLTFIGLAIGCSGSSSGTSPAPAPAISISGTNQARLGSNVQFTATVSNTTNTAVTWQVNGTPGGSTTTGTISATGLYTPPASIPSPNTVSITAVTQATPATTSTPITESILNPLPVVTAGTAVQGLSVTSYNLTVTGTGFLPTSQIDIAGTAVTTTFVSSTQLTATITPAVNTLNVLVSVTNPDPGGSTSSTAQVALAQTTLTSAARLLDQATFGPTLNDVEHVEQVGINGYLAEQFALAPTLLPDITTPPPTLCTNTTTPCEQSEWWKTTLTAPDQLRQRVAFALSELFVISTSSVNARAVTPYQNILLNDAFGNFATIMHDVTLSPGMGAYLNMLNSNKPGTVNGVPQIANENYARELMQLFTTGIDLLNPDGTLQLDGSGNPQPVYTETQVQAFARAFTGWTYATSTGGSPATFPNNTANFDAAMAAVEGAHDAAAKTLLSTTLPAGQTAEQDLAGALANIFNHTNVGPFVCKQLIQHLVTSNPSPAYVSRVAAVFANNGQGVRGDMKAIITAILTDSEARSGDTNASFDGGHLREPMLYLTNVMRGLGYVNTDPNGYYNTASSYTSPLGEQPYTSPSVFNFFPPDYVIPGTTINAPEFGQENTASAILRLTLANTLVYNRVTGFSVDLSATSPLGKTASATGNAMTDSTNLVNSLSIIFMHGQMPSQMQSAIVNHIATLTDPAERVRVAAYLVITSSHYKIEH